MKMSQFNIFLMKNVCMFKFFTSDDMYYPDKAEEVNIMSVTVVLLREIPVVVLLMSPNILLVCYINICKILFWLIYF